MGRRPGSGHTAIRHPMGRHPGSRRPTTRRTGRRTGRPPRPAGQGGPAPERPRAALRRRGRRDLRRRGDGRRPDRRPGRAVDGRGPGRSGKPDGGRGPDSAPDRLRTPAPAPGPVPDGYTAVDDERGFTLAVPAGARRSTDGERVFYTTADGAVWVGIRIRAVPSGGAIGAMRTADASGPRNNPGYRDAVVEETRHKGLPAARWEFTWNGFTSAEGPRRTVDLCWEQAGTLYDVWVSAPEGRAGEARGHFAAALDSFRTSGRSSGGSTGD